MSTHLSRTSSKLRHISDNEAQLVTKVSDLSRIERTQELYHLTPQDIHVHTFGVALGRRLDVGGQTESVWDSIEGGIDNLPTAVSYDVQYFEDVNNLPLANFHHQT